ncbi:CusA/CzcA family heavy metal efflux RND transporter [Lentiprolixibacter aurantiacus]|uniref:CusA/CzcA family heavy metal efflux RND transporter n=1 Tax=Lentiprolixibacter aurantiacus TaxID=2993939 RepID=A0AAE3MME1_9FLAO|nr:CusA/CzcA family heavy metal efflux RND transporter [Lentiprolixibacter aurantiacus]MCX2720124.1 CusA/CzcA family heavy metal efflux RND transporter [Lentiprolixibacter aurantiacus]
MLTKIIQFSLRNKLLVLISIGFVTVFGMYALTQISIGAVPDITNNQVQVITTSRNLSTQDMEQFVTYPVELEMANLPGVQEIRSISKFGLSVVTIVFEDAMGTYLPRQLIAEKIKSASEKIPEGFGSPEMGPISTGLGEIYQYILDTKPGYESRYSAMDLRTIQDWIVKRQLSGIPGVVEVNTWGGELKQYEIAIDPEQLQAMEISISQVFSALENNNSVAGGGYIEKLNDAYFIRGEGLITSLNDIEKTVVANRNGQPVLVGDIAEVGYGKAIRFGAITGNAQGEKVLGQVMMLKHANSKEVIEAVKARVSEISETLPEGVYINDFLERSELIGKTTTTVVENLILGCLIVVFVVVLLLGNFRSGFIVASVIPLSLLFAISLMYVFGVDANLMSLGAIDFGIIIDGAVIIVEYTSKRFARMGSVVNHTDAREVSNQTALISASKMMNSAIFGQFIILIVFIPVLSLSGVEGKMFRPMALTFSFALLGAMILCLTYVPIISALFLKPGAKQHSRISRNIIPFLERLYDPSIVWALRKKKLVIGIALALLLGSGYLFSTMGAEFVPTLDEGDFVIQPVLPTGTSLTKTIEITTEIETILLDQFPEVDQVVTRIGAAEVPTDPMSMEESDVIITLKPKKEWVSARSKDDLAEKFKEALALIPGMEVEFTQPIEMRFNELITGVRADIAIKVFGEDLEILSAKANEIKTLIEEVPGAADITVEKIVGLPQLNVRYNRSKLALYGLQINSLNRIIEMGFAGVKLGTVFEGEKRFDLTLRLNQRHRTDLESLRNLYVDTPGGQKIPLRELAEITFTEGAAKIARDDTRRRIVVGVNVRNRDLQSVVDDIQERIQEHLELPAGYSVSYGGQFENLQKARNRLLVAVPISLLLIFILLFFAFRSVRDTLLVYTAIPLAAVGGVWLLWLRDMPFSISAGIGFIALFGIAVLNGIVLIEHFKELKEEGTMKIEDLVREGTHHRLRAVLLTAAAAALGFLPMAVSTNVGAEVQRPLATVVIGGLVTATLLTLIVLPVLYSLFSGKTGQGSRAKSHIPTILLLLGLFCTLPDARAQSEPLGLGELKMLAFENNAHLKSVALSRDSQKSLMGAAFDFDKTQVFYSYDQNNLAINGKPLEVYGIQQDIKFPLLYFTDRKVRKSLWEQAENQLQLERRQLEGALASSYYQLQYISAKTTIYHSLDSLFTDMSRAASRRYELGGTNYLEKVSARAKQQQIATVLNTLREDYQAQLELINQLVQTEDILEIRNEPLAKLTPLNYLVEDHPGMRYVENQSQYLTDRRRLESQSLLPDISFSYFQGTNSTLNRQLYGYQMGFKIPILFPAKTSRIRASRLAEEAGFSELRDYRIRLESAYEQLLHKLSRDEVALEYYEKEGQILAGEIQKMAELGYRNGELDLFQYIQSLEQVSTLRLSYLDHLNRYNQTVIEINYLILK